MRCCKRLVLVTQSTSEVSELRATVGMIQKARRLESEAVEEGRPPTAASHRGPGAPPGPPPARTAPEKIINAEFFSAAKAASPVAPPVDPQNPFAIGIGARASPSPGARKGFTHYPTRHACINA